jgi:uncharacterized protein
MADGRSWTVRGRPLVAGAAAGRALVLGAPLSFWGGLDLDSGRIIDARHPQHGVSVAGTVLVMPGGRGSSSSSSVLAEALRIGRGPAAVILPRADDIVVLGALVAQLLDDVTCPVIELAPADHARIMAGDGVVVAGDGSVEVSGAGALT